MTPRLTDLFGEIPVTLADVELWLDVVPAIPRTSWRRDHYASNWNVTEKIRRTKAAGAWHEIENARTEQLRALLG
jgi:hypothetical protein